MVSYQRRADEVPADGQTGIPVSASAAEVFKAAAHPVRARILELLCHGERSIPQLVEGTGVKGSHLSRHLAQMRGQHLVHCAWSDGRLLYHLACPEAGDLLDAAQSVLHARMVAELAGVRQLNSSSRPEAPPPSGALAPASGAGAQLGATFSDEQFAALEATLASRSVITDACEAIAERHHCSLDTAARHLIATANENDLSLRQAAAGELQNLQRRT
ncbi:helix-turn-helix domain-containing protein [Arthrobacter sp. ISL-85]|uniref:ArsR/SmtB family transcription factor n=1 Tax=Arthrobacter sp. ISL-85 TaxID=2819115 RepID=UPI001BE86188|nr:ArsR family transcriptional regulator [Arthrobacter sp. ISL-85]MBT2566295.1 helix-turn-helix domain-containing protein [Arthrobacter sp. ISL-85]